VRTPILCVAFISLLGIAIGQDKQQHTLLGQNSTGNDFYSYCPSSYKEATNAGGITPTWCVAYVEGFVGGYNYSEILEKGSAGPSSPMTNAQVYDLVAQYVLRHPEKRSRDLKPTIYEALNPYFHWGR
jgi:hypothetical protein